MPMSKADSLWKVRTTVSDVINLKAVTEAKSEQARAESIQRKILAAQLAAQTLANTEGPSGFYVNEILEAYDTFLTVE